LREAISNGITNMTVCGYLLGVASGAVSVPVIAYLRLLIERAISGMEVQSRQLPVTGWILVFGAVVVLLFFWVAIALVLALFPFVPAYWIAFRWRLGHWFYYAFTGALAGLPLALAFVSIDSLTPVRGAELWLVFVKASPFFSVGGAIGGLVFWCVAIKKTLREGNGG